MGYEKANEQEMEFTVDSLFPVGQIRLTEISVCNWGSFSNIHTAKIDPEGTLITGDTGAGKSTFIDGLMALLQPAGRASFNVAAAQGDRTDRNLMSYIRGHYGADHDGVTTKTKSKRGGAVVTGLRALYMGENGSYVTLVGLFWTTQATHSLSDLKRLYIIANRNLTLEEVMSHFQDGNHRILKQRLHDDPEVFCSTDNFSEYQALYQKSLYMENRNAPNLLARALGLKKIDDLTTIIRELVLEPSSGRQDARDAVGEFEDLVAIHQELTDARERKTQLLPLIDIDQSLREANQKIAKYLAQQEALPVYVNRQANSLFEARKDKLDGQVVRLGDRLELAETMKKDAIDIVDGRHEIYIKAGGGRVETLEGEISQANENLQRTLMMARKYQADARELSLPDELLKSHFEANKAKAEETLPELGKKEQASIEAFGKLSNQYSVQQDEVNALTTEIDEIEKRPNSNIDIKYQRLRDRMVDDLSLQADQCVFIGELIDVLDDQREWQGAIERVLGMHRLTLAVPNQIYSQVTKWLNKHHTGLYVRVQVVNTEPKQPPTFKTDGFLRKLSWLDHPYREWVKHYLSTYDLHCVDSTDKLDQTLYSMTRQGLVHLGEGSFEKKDQYKIDDRLQWYLGYSNAARLKAMMQALKTMKENFAETYKALEEAKKQLDDDKKEERLWRKLTEYEWDEVNAPYWDKKHSLLISEKQALEDSDLDLTKAKKLWEQAKADLGRIQRRISRYKVISGTLSAKLQSVTIQLEAVAPVARLDIPEPVLAQLDEIVAPLADADLDKLSQILSKYDHDIGQAYAGSSGVKQRLERKAIGIMSSFRAQEKWKSITADWGADIESIPDYLDHLQHLIDDGLPELEDRFKMRLNKHTTQALARIKQNLDSERDDIIERIETISGVLERTEFMPGTSLRLSAYPENFPHVNAFLKEVTATLSMATSDDHEARYQQLASVMETLRKASDPATCNTQESLRLLDPRYQMTFRAEEIVQETQEVRDVWVSSSGKSGGEKESFAGAIVAASLAYVLTPDGYHKPVYATVFLDEAFSNTSESVSRRILKIFKDLHIHINLITPYKNLNLARESARSLLIVERDADNHESHLSEVTWEQVDRDIARNKAASIKAEAEELGIELE